MTTTAERQLHLADQAARLATWASQADDVINSPFMFTDGGEVKRGQLLAELPQTLAAVDELAAELTRLAEQAEAASYGELARAFIDHFMSCEQCGPAELCATGQERNRRVEQARQPRARAAELAQAELERRALLRRMIAHVFRCEQCGPNTIESRRREIRFSDPAALCPAAQELHTQLEANRLTLADLDPPIESIAQP